MPVRGRWLALVEAGNLPVELDHELETVGRTDLGGTLPGGLSAHPHLDHDTGEMAGQVLEGRFAGVAFDALTQQQLLELLNDFVSKDDESAALLRARVRGAVDGRLRGARAPRRMRLG